MSIYKLQLIDELKKTVCNNEGGFKIGKYLIVILEDKYSQEITDALQREITAQLRRSFRDQDYCVTVLAGIHPDTIKLFRVSPIDLAVEKEGKSIYSRKLRRKRVSKNTDKADDKVLKEKEEAKEVPKEEASRGDGKRTPWWEWYI